MVAARIAAPGSGSGRGPATLPNGRLRGREPARGVRRSAAASRHGPVLLAEREGLSGRGTERLLRVARTIADLEGRRRSREPHLDEAARFRAPADDAVAGGGGLMLGHRAARAARAGRG